MKEKETNRHTLGIVIPVYKLKEKYLRQCIESILNQTELDLEVILVDDCSPDNCGLLCDEFAASNSKIKVIHHEKNKGLPAARNTGLSYLNSEWVSFVDGDDWVDIDTFSIILKKIKALKNKPDFVMFPGCLSYRDKEIVDEKYFNYEWKTKQEMNELQTLALSMPLKIYPERAVAYDTAWAKIISYDYLVANNIQFRNLQYREDGMYFQELVEHASYIIQLSDGMYHYRVTEGSMVHSYRPEATTEQMKYLKMLWGFAKKYNKSENYYKSLYACALVSMQVCITCYFYHRKNIDNLNRRKKCIKYFSQKPYNDVFKNIYFCELKRNFLIKAILIYTKNYLILNLIREYYFKNKNYICYE